LGGDAGLKPGDLLPVDYRVVMTALREIAGVTPSILRAWRAEAEAELRRRGMPVDAEKEPPADAE
jgi:hypothetical protein